MAKGKFLPGQFYDFGDWFTRKLSRWTVINVIDDRVWFKVVERETGDVTYEEKPIFLDTEDNEYILLYIYMDCEARIPAHLVDEIYLPPTG